MASDQDDTIFNSADQNAISTKEGITNTGNQDTPPAIPALVQDLIGEGKKYKDIEAALSSIPHALNHINTLEEENTEFRLNEGKSKSMEDVLEAISNQSNNDTSQTGEVDESKIVDKVVQTLTETAQKGQKKLNIKAASDSLVSLAGGNKEASVELLKAKAESMGVGVDDLMAIAAKSPTGFMQLFATTEKTEEGTSTSQPSQGTINTQNLLNQGPKEGTFDWWMEQKKEKGVRWYSSAAMSKKRIEDADRLGREEFFQSK